jgi:hypothetical protein
VLYATNSSYPQIYEDLGKYSLPLTLSTQIYEGLGKYSLPLTLPIQVHVDLGMYSARLTLSFIQLVYWIGKISLSYRGGVWVDIVRFFTAFSLHYIHMNLMFSCRTCVLASSSMYCKDTYLHLFGGCIFTNIFFIIWKLMENP